MNNLIQERINPYQKAVNTAVREIFLDVKTFWGEALKRLEYIYNNGYFDTVIMRRLPPKNVDYCYNTLSNITKKEYFITVPNQKKEVPVSIWFKLKEEGFIENADWDWYITGYSSHPDITLWILLNPDKLKQAKNPKWSKVYYDMVHLITHEYEHSLQDILKNDRLKDYEHDYKYRHSGKYKESPIHIGGKLSTNTSIAYYTELASEVEAELQSYWLSAKKLRNTKKYKGKSRPEVFFSITKEGLKKTGQFNLEEINYIIKKWKEYAKEHFPYMKFS